jgi:hypothetical protein
MSGGRASRTVGFTNYDRQSTNFRETSTASQRGQREEAVSQAGIPLRTGFRDAGAGLRKNSVRPQPKLYPATKNLLMLEDTTSAARRSWMAESSVLAADGLRQGGYLRLRVYGESMLPALWPGDEVEIKSCSLQNLRLGEIVLAMRDNRFFLHRLVATSPSNGFLLCGDSMPGPDPLFPAEALLGHLVANANRGLRICALRPGFGAKCSRALGLLLCQFSLARRVALKLHTFTERFSANRSAFEVRKAEVGRRANPAEFGT